MKFLDQAKIFVRAGAGGAGCASFLHDKRGRSKGPDGGNGGRGGSVWVRANAALNTLIDFRYRQHFRARDGRPGGPQNRTGANASDLTIEVPPGTEIRDVDGEVALWDITEPDQTMELARGGDAGFGNAHFKSSTYRAPLFAEPGRAGEERALWLKLKLIADAGIVGLPNAGKSTFLAAVSRAHPKVADYPFTTLAPTLGVAAIGDKVFVLADIPGLIAGAHTGAGLGDRFLGHIERCRALLHLVDGTADDVAENYRTVRRELDAYGHGLAAKPEVVALAKCDSLDDRAIEAGRTALQEASGAIVVALSSLSGRGRGEALERLASHLARREPRPPLRSASG